MGLGSEALRELQEAVNICQERGLKREAFNLLKRVSELDPENIPNRLSLADLLMREGLEAESREEFGNLLDMVEKAGAADQIVRVSEQMLAHFPDAEDALVSFAGAKIKVGMAADAIGRLVDMKPGFPDSIAVREALVAAYDAVGDTQSKSDAYREIAELFKQRGNDEKAREILQRFVTVKGIANDPSTNPDEPGIADLSAGGLIDFTSEGIGSDAPPEPITPPRLSNLPVDPEPIAADPPATLDDDDLEGESYEDLIAQAKVELDFGDPDAARRYAQKANELDPNAVTAREILQRVGGAPPEELELEDEGTLPDIELVLVDDPDDDDSFGSVEPPLEVEMGLAAASSAASEEPDDDVSSDEIEIDLDDLDLATADTPVQAPGVTSSDEDFSGSSSTTWAKQSSWVHKTLGAAEAIYSKGLLDEAKMLYEQVLEHAPNHPQAMLRLGEIEAAQSVDEDEEAFGVATDSGFADTLADDSAASLAPDLHDEDAEIDIDGVLGDEQPEPIAVSPKPKATPQAKPKAKPEPKAAAAAKRGPSIELPEDLAFGDEDDEDSEDVSESVEVGFDDLLADDASEDAAASLETLMEESAASPEEAFEEFEVDLGEELDVGAAELDEEPIAVAAEPDPLEDTLTEEPIPHFAAADDDVIEAEEEPEVVAVARSPRAAPTALDLDDDDIVAAEEEPEVVEDAIVAADDEDAIDDLLGQFPDDGVVRAEAEEEEGFDLAAELEQGSVAPAQEPAFADVFRAFKKGIEEQVSAEDAAAHYDLAIAYKEMGLYDDAIEALEKVQKNACLAVEGLSLLATCKLEQGKADEAASVLVRALEVAATANEQLALRYDLGLAYLSAGKKDAARAAFEEVAAQDSGFREVQEQLAELSS